MNEQEKKDYAIHRMETAFKTLDAARLLAENEYYNASVNRLYYALFYAVNALLVLNEIYPKSHTGTKHLFSLHFIKTNKLDIKYGRLFAKLYDWRQMGDYDTFREFDGASVLSLMVQVEEMILLIKEDISSSFK